MIWTKTDCLVCLYSSYGHAVKERILFKVLLLVYKCKKGLAPEYLHSLCIPYKDYNSRSNNLDLLDPGPKSNKKTYGDHSCKVAGAKEWNSFLWI